MVENTSPVCHTPAVQSSCSKCTRCESKSQTAPILVEELNKSLAINNDLKEAEKVFNEKTETLTNDLAAMTDVKNVLEIQQEDLLIHGRVKNGIGYKAIPHPCNGNFTGSPKQKVDINHLPDFSLSADPILSTSNPEEEKPVNRRDGKQKMRNSNEFSKKSNSFQSYPKPGFQNTKPGFQNAKHVFVKPTHVWAKRHDTKNVTSDDLFKSEKDLAFSTPNEASSSASDFIKDDDFRVDISSSILDPITIKHVRAVSEVSEASSSQYIDVSSSDSHVEEPISPIYSIASKLPEVNNTNL
ncbi:hypothetical protein L1987_42382 [Smallanthus sonchifolius]|uniref:Uncharacterized protein n=1 Tax=Smallanthus sonchifolius TaxID=185202 RepID=A0ACB9GIP7_9ASTR|nr:hypothetical protein L1987_42382 [Smallanthus sonchifolius]